MESLLMKMKLFAISCFLLTAVATSTKTSTSLRGTKADSNNSNSSNTGKTHSNARARIRGSNPRILLLKEIDINEKANEKILKVPKVPKKEKKPKQPHHPKPNKNSALIGQGTTTSNNDNNQFFWELEKDEPKPNTTNSVLIGSGLNINGNSNTYNSDSKNYKITLVEETETVEAEMVRLTSSPTGPLLSSVPTPLPSLFPTRHPTLRPTWTFQVPDTANDSTVDVDVTTSSTEADAIDATEAKAEVCNYCTGGDRSLCFSPTATVQFSAHTQLSCGDIQIKAPSLNAFSCELQRALIEDSCCNCISNMNNEVLPAPMTSISTETEAETETEVAVPADELSLNEYNNEDEDDTEEDEDNETETTTGVSSKIDNYGPPPPPTPGTPIKPVLVLENGTTVVRGRFDGGGLDQDPCTFCVGQEFLTDNIITFLNGSDKVSCNGFRQIASAGLSASFCEIEKVPIETACCRNSAITSAPVMKEVEVVVPLIEEAELEKSVVQEAEKAAIEEEDELKQENEMVFEEAAIEEETVEKEDELVFVGGVAFDATGSVAAVDTVGTGGTPEDRPAGVEEEEKERGFRTPPPQTIVLLNPGEVIKVEDDPTAAVTVIETSASSSCSAHPQCAALQLEDNCCPTTITIGNDGNSTGGWYLDCCTKVEEQVEQEELVEEVVEVKEETEKGATDGNDNEVVSSVVDNINVNEENGQKTLVLISPDEFSAAQNNNNNENIPVPTAPTPVNNDGNEEDESITALVLVDKNEIQVEDQAEGRKSVTNTSRNWNRIFDN